MSLLALATPPTVAQGEPHFQIEPKIDQPAKTIEKDHGSVEFLIDITVKPSQQASPLASQFRIRLELTLDPAQAPNGYGFARSGPAECNDAPLPTPMTCNVDPGETIQVRITVSNIVSDPSTDRVPFTLIIKSTPVFTGQPNPVTEQIIAQMQQSDTERVSGTANLKLDTSERIASFVNRYPWLMIAGAAGIVLISVVLIRKRRAGVSVATDSPIQEVLPGRGASFPLQVTNESTAREHLSLTTSDVPAGWSAILPVDRIELGPNETTTIWLTLKSPASAHPGEHVQINFVASTGEGLTAETLVEAVVVERYGARPPAPAPAAAAPPVEPSPAPEPAPMQTEAPIRPQPRVARAVPKRRR